MDRKYKRKVKRDGGKTEFPEVMNGEAEGKKMLKEMIAESQIQKS